MNPKMFVPDVAAFVGKTPQRVHQELREKYVEFFHHGKYTYFTHHGAKKYFNFQIPSQIIATYLPKGGTGKSTIAENFAYRASLLGLKVLAIDCDPQATLTNVKLGLESSKPLPCLMDIISGSISIENSVIKFLDGLDVIPSSLVNMGLESKIKDDILSIKKILAPLKKKYDVIIIDCPPAFGLTVGALTLAADKVICPTLPDPESMDGIKNLESQLKLLEENCGLTINYKILLNQVDMRTILSKKNLEIMNTIHGDKTLRSYIKKSQEFPNATAKRKTIFDDFKGDSKTDIDLLLQEVLCIGANQ